jgi:hypothetical protein
MSNNRGSSGLGTREPQVALYVCICSPNPEHGGNPEGDHVLPSTPGLYLYTSLRSSITHPSLPPYSSTYLQPLSIFFSWRKRGGEAHKVLGSP